MIILKFFFTKFDIYSAFIFQIMELIALFQNHINLLLYPKNTTSYFNFFIFEKIH